MTKRFEVQLDYGGNPVNKTYEQQAGVDDWKDAVELAITELLEYERGEREMEEGQDGRITRLDFLLGEALEGDAAAPVRIKRR